jgi:hypothetical protein
MALMQLNMFGPPEDVENCDTNRGRCDDKPVPWERENLWPKDLVACLGVDLLEELYGDIPRFTRLHVKQVCRRLKCDSNLVYEHLQMGSLDGTEIGADGAERGTWRVYRYSLVSFLFNREFRDGRSRGDVSLSPNDLDRIERAVAARNQNRQKKGKIQW